MIVNGTRIYQENLEALMGGKRRALNEGGTSSTKTYSILQILALAAQNEKLLISVVSESLPHLKRGCIRDFINILGDTFDEKRWNKSNFIYNFGKGVIEFFPADDPAKMRGGRRDILFINEANNVAYNSFRELDIRTRLFTFLDWNPVSEFWAHEYRLKDSEENAFIHSTYMDSFVLGKDGVQRSVLPQEVIENIESNKNDVNWWHVYGLGLMGKIAGLVYPYPLDKDLVDELPKGDKVYGLDFGFSNDPCVLVANVLVGDSLYSQELIYKTELTNDAISREMDLLGVRHNYDEIFADSAEPKSIEEIAQFRYNIQPSAKGPGSVEYGHQKVNQFKQYWTKDSLNCIKEQRNFRYIEDKDGKLTEKTTHKWSHGMDARRYALSSHIEVVGGSNKIPVLAPRG